MSLTNKLFAHKTSFEFFPSDIFLVNIVAIVSPDASWSDSDKSTFVRVVSVLKNVVLVVVIKSSAVTPRPSSSSLDLKFIIPEFNTANLPSDEMYFVISEYRFTSGIIMLVYPLIILLVFCSYIIPFDIDTPYKSNIDWKFVKSMLVVFGSAKIIMFPPLFIYDNIISFSYSEKSSSRVVKTNTLQSSGTLASTNKSRSSTSLA